MPLDDHAVRHWPPQEAAIPRDIRKALDHMRASVGDPITEAELAAISGVPERTLRKHFKRFVGLSPIAHLRRLRLAAARAELLACEGRLSVTEIATRHGFAHLGRFAADYARCFGEPPSATLARGLREAEDREQDWRREEAARVLAEADDDGMRRPHLGRQAPTLLIVPFQGASGREQAQFAADVPDSVASGIRRGAIARASRKRPGSSTADDLVLRATPMLLAYDPASVMRAIDLMDHAMAMDPDHARAPALSAYAHALAFEHRVFAGETGASVMAAKLRVQALAQRATALDTVGDPMVLHARAMVVRGQGERDQSEAIVARAVAIDPTASLALHQSAFWKSGRGNTDGAIRDLNRAIRLDGAHAPFAGRLAGIGCAHLIAGRYAEAAPWLRRALATNPDAIMVNGALAATYALLGETQAARRALDALRRAYPGLTLTSYAATCSRGGRERTLNALASIGLPP